MTKRAKDSGHYPPQRLFARIAVALAADIERVTPGKIESQSLDRRLVSQIEHLLEDQGTQRNVKVLRRTSKPRIKTFGQLLNWKRLKKILAKNACPVT